MSSPGIFPAVLDVHHAVLIHRAHLFDCPAEYDAIFLKDGTIRAIGRRSDVLRTAVREVGIADEFTPEELDCPRVLAAALRARQGIISNDDEGLPFMQVIDGGRDDAAGVGGMLVCPGFVDSHVHLLDAGRRATGVSLRECRNRDEFREAVRIATQVVEPGCWILGGDWDNEKLGEYPDRTWIDDITPDHPVLLSRFDCHSALANSIALRLAQIDLTVGEEVEGGVMERLSDGTLSGIVREKGIARVKVALPEADTASSMAIALAEAGRELVRHGITGVHTMTSLDFKNVREVEFLELAAVHGRLPIRVACAVRPKEMAWAAEHSQQVATDAERAAKDDVPICGAGGQRWHPSRWVRVLGAKIFLDGSLGSRTAAFLEPFSDRGGRGVSMVPDADLAKVFEDADHSGLMVMAHAIGDGAVRRLLCAFETYVFDKRDERRKQIPIQLRVEHCQHVSDEDLERIRRITSRSKGLATVVASMQPTHADSDCEVVASAVGAHRVHQAYRFRSLAEHGAILAFGSDWMVMPPRPVDTLIAATRPPHPFAKSEAVSPAEVIRAFSSGSAKAARWEDHFGCLKVGLAADLTVLRRDVAAPGARPAEPLEPLIAYTIVDGMVRYQAKNLPTRTSTPPPSTVEC